MLLLAVVEVDVLGGGGGRREAGHGGVYDVAVGSLLC